VTDKPLIDWLRTLIAPLVADPGALEVRQVGDTGSTLILAITLAVDDLPHLIGREHATLKALERLACLHGRQRGFAEVILTTPQARSRPRLRGF
jgi:predicted RNA-binding protein YlqC (UPF0109 family)